MQVISSPWGALAGLPSPELNHIAKDAPRQTPGNFKTSPSVRFATGFGAFDYSEFRSLMS
jgi:hypothetical protein